MSGRGCYEEPDHDGRREGLDDEAGVGGARGLGQTLRSPPPLLP